MYFCRLTFHSWVHFIWLFRWFWVSGIMTDRFLECWSCGRNNLFLRCANEFFCCSFSSFLVAFILFFFNIFFISCIRGLMVCKYFCSFTAYFEWAHFGSNCICFYLFYICFDSKFVGRTLLIWICLLEVLNKIFWLYRKLLTMIESYLLIRQQSSFSFVSPFFCWKDY